MSRLYEVLFYDGDQQIPAYYLIGGIKGRSATEAMKRNLPALTELARRRLNLGGDYPAHKIHESLYVLRDDGLVGARTGR